MDARLQFAGLGPKYELYPPFGCLQPANGCRPPVNAAYAGQTGGIRVDDKARSRTQRAFELLLRPLDDVVELLVALRELGHHHGIDGLVVHLGTNFRTRGRAEHRGLLIGPGRIAVHDALRRLDRLPGLEVVHALERWQVVPARSGNQLGHRFFLRHMEQEIFACRLVLRETPQSVELRELSDKTALRTTRHGVMPDVFRDLDIVTLGDRPRAWRVHDAGAFAGNDPPVIAGVVPRVDLRWIHRH